MFFLHLFEYNKQHKYQGNKDEIDLNPHETINDPEMDNFHFFFSVM